MSVKNFFIALINCLLVFTFSSLTVFATIELPEGAVKGLPERLAVLDDEGRAVNSETGEYFFHVEHMQYGQTYSKNIQLMNLQEDQAYYLYFYIEPLYKTGEIDLEKGCNCKFFLDNTEIYQGNLIGNGNIDLAENYFNCGHYRPGDSHVLRCEIIWNDLNITQQVDNGHRLIDKDGEYSLTGTEESGYLEGEISFKWIFFASVHEINSHIEDEPDTTENSNNETVNETAIENLTDVRSNFDESETNKSEKQESAQNHDETFPADNTSTNTYSNFFSPFTGYLVKNGTVWLICIGIVSLGIIILLILLNKEKQKRKKKK